MTKFNPSSQPHNDNDQSINIYNQFIETLKLDQLKRSLTPKEYQKHRILPGHSEGTYDAYNVIFVTYEEHIKAHKLRYMAFGEKGDQVAYLFMESKTKEANKALCQHGGTNSAKKHKRNKTLFYSKNWQEQYGDLNGGQRNIQSGHIRKLNKAISEKNPSLRSEAGKIGGKICSDKQRAEQSHFFDPTHSVQKKANFLRWGSKINNKRIPHCQLSEHFIDLYEFYILNKVKK
jgi:hypothetical protein